MNNERKMKNDETNKLTRRIPFLPSAFCVLPLH